MSEEYREYLTPESGVVGSDGRLYRAYLVPDDCSETPDLSVSLVTYLEDSRCASEAGPLADDMAVTIRRAISEFRYAAGYRWDGLSMGMVIKSDAMLVRYLSIFHDMLAEPVEFGSNRNSGVAFMERAEFTPEQFGTDFPTLTAQEVETYNYWADGDVWGYVVEVSCDQADAYTEFHATDGDWDNEDSVFGFYGRNDAITYVHDVLKDYGVKA